MEIKDYCRNVEQELTVWKARMYDLIHKMDRLPTEKVEKVRPHVEDLKMAISDMEVRLEKLRTECPTEWSPMRKEIEEAHVDMRSWYDEADTTLGKAAPISIPG